MTAEHITTKYSIGDVVYYVIHPTADIIQGVIQYVRIIPTPAGIDITYRVNTTTITVKVLDYVQESELMSFADAKTALLTWLNSQTVKVTAMTEPNLPV